MKHLLLEVVTTQTFACGTSLCQLRHAHVGGRVYTEHKSLVSLGVPKVGVGGKMGRRFLKFKGRSLLRCFIGSPMELLIPSTPQRENVP